MNIKSLTFLIALLNQLLISYGQTSITIPVEFVETIPPKVSSPEWFKLNYSNNEFGVKNVNGKLEIKKVKENHEYDLKLPNGTLTAIDHGEFGGTLTFFPIDSTKKSVLIKEGNINFIFYFKDKIYFIEGLAHGESSVGALFSLDTAEQIFKYQKILDFEDAPEAFAIFEGKFLVVTHANFYIVKDFQKELIFKDTFWDSLYPNSIATFDNANIFVGMRGGIVKIDLTAKSFRFYKNAK
jgi:hypothetical protein